MTQNVSNPLHAWSCHLYLFSQLRSFCLRVKKKSINICLSPIFFFLNLFPPNHWLMVTVRSQTFRFSQAESQVPNLSHLPLTLDLPLHCVPTVPCGFSILSLAPSRDATLLPVFFNILRCADFGYVLQAQWHIFTFLLTQMPHDLQVKTDQNQSNQGSPPPPGFFVLNLCTLLGAPYPVSSFCYLLIHLLLSP